MTRIALLLVTLVLVGCSEGTGPLELQSDATPVGEVGVQGTPRAADDSGLTGNALAGDSTATWVRGDGPRPRPADLDQREGLSVPVSLADCNGNLLFTVSGAEYTQWRDALDYLSLKASDEAGCLNPGVYDEYLQRLDQRGLSPADLETSWRDSRK